MYLGVKISPLAQAIRYGICALIVSFGVNHFLRARGVLLELCSIGPRFLLPSLSWQPGGERGSETASFCRCCWAPAGD
jgi:hypothetical protein